MSPTCRIGCASATVPAGECTADGYWHCATCHVSFPNNASATFHESARPDHLLAWWCFDHNRLESIVASTPEAHR